MIDIAWSEFFFIALLALILIGPKELPTVLRAIGRWVGKIRAFTTDLSTQLDSFTQFTPEREDTRIDKVKQSNLPSKDEEINAKSKL